jgi:hypothetical protein
VITVWGECGGPNSLSATRDRSGRLAEAYTYRDLSLELPERGVMVDADHDGQRLGELVFAELGDDARLRAVCVLDDDVLTDIERPVYFSPTLQMRGSGIDRTDTYIARTAELLGVSLTFATARSGAHPLSWRRGDFRSSYGRSHWPLSWRSEAPLLARAVDNRAGMLQTRSAPRIVDRSRESALDNLVGRRAGSVHPSELELAEDPHWQHRPLRQSGHRGRVLSVR